MQSLIGHLWVVALIGLGVSGLALQRRFASLRLLVAEHHPQLATELGAAPPGQDRLPGVVAVLRWLIAGQWHVYEAEHGTLGDNAVIPNFIDINFDSSSHGRFVQLRENGAWVTFNNVDGGSGGYGAVEIRYLPNSGGTVQITVNGSHVQTMSVAQQQTHFEWRRLRFEDVPLNAGTNNSIEVRRLSTTSWQRPALDHITVSRPDELALAEAHRAALSLGAEDLDRMLRYLLELDGRDSNGQIGLRDFLFRDRFRFQ